jgi:hypothetical protein
MKERMIRGVVFEKGQPIAFVLLDFKEIFSQSARAYDDRREREQENEQNETDEMGKFLPV